MNLSFEEMNPGFKKYHLDLDGLRPSIHRFTDVDRGDPHDHPASFTTHILKGGYVEEVYELDADGTWSVDRVSRPAGTSHTVAADRIHRIVELPHGECWTLVFMEPHARETRFWRFGESIHFRPWHSREWTLFTPTQQKRTT